MELRRPAGFESGASYSTTLGRPQALRHEVLELRAALERALAAPVGLTLRPVAASQGSPWIGDGWQQEAEAVAESVVRLMTSGTTGTPKLREHRLAACLARKKPGERTERWVLTYAPYRWAGLSVMLHCMASQCELTAPNELTPEGIVAAARAQGATHISLTPSLLRKMQVAVGDGALGALGLEQVTFGGEAASQPVLDAARRLWPKAKITQVYASTELGDVLSVSDGKEGIPAGKLERDGISFSESGELVVNGYATGDLWRRQGERYYFAGRVEEVINVGGHKVAPVAVERVALGITGVEACRAYGVSNALLGQLVALEYVGSAAIAEVREGMRRALEKASWPAVIRNVAEIQLTEANKVKRIER